MYPNNSRNNNDNYNSSNNFIHNDVGLVEETKRSIE